MKTQTATQTTFLFPKLLAALTAEIEKRNNEYILEIQSPETDLTMWRFKDLFPKGKTEKDFSTRAEAVEYLVKRVAKKQPKQIEKQAAMLTTISEAPDFSGMRISVEWKKSAMWGSNPRAEGADGWGHYESGSIGGCGYDKGSTAVANVMNQSNGFLKALYLHAEKNQGVPLRELFGYGSGYGILPRIEGGVGVSCYPAICAAVGLKFETSASGKSYDAYRIEKA